MDAKLTPTFGFTQPTFGDSALVSFRPVMGQAKRPKFAALRTRRIVARNISERMQLRYKTASDKVKALAEDAGTSLSTIQRATQPEKYNTGITIDVLTQIAMGLRCEPHELLTPNEKDD